MYDPLGDLHNLAGHTGQPGRPPVWPTILFLILAAGCAATFVGLG